jgi:hypothetical protein
MQQFPQYGTCTVCPAKASSLLLLVSISLPLVIVLPVLVGVMYLIRSLALRGTMEVGVNMVQIDVEDFGPRVGVLLCFLAALLS